MENLNKYVEHTLLKQDAVKADFVKLFNEAKEHKFLGVCINPSYVKFAKDYLNINLKTFQKILLYEMMYNNYFMCLLLLDVFLNTKEIYKEKAQMIKEYKEMKAKMQEK